MSRLAQRTIVLVTAALLLVPFASSQTLLNESERHATGHLPPMPPRNASAQPWPTNTLVVTTEGLVASSSYIGANLTDITITGVSPSAKGFTLTNPSQVAVFVNQSATSGGTVLFFHVVLTSGVWIVTQRVNAADVPVLAFDTSSLPSSFKMATLVPPVRPAEKSSAAGGTSGGSGGGGTGGSTGGSNSPSNSCSFVGDYVSCSFVCNQGDTIHVTSHDPTPGDYPSTHARCGGVDKSCQGYEGATCDFGPTSSGGSGTCYSDTVSNQGSCSSSGGGPTNPNPPPCTTPNYGYTLQNTENAWTPNVIGHSPYGGSATAQALWTSSTSRYVAPWGLESGISESVTLNLNNGDAKAAVQQAQWGIYAVHDVNGCDSGTYYTARTIQWFNNFDTPDISGSDPRTDANLATSVDGVVYFDTRYQTADSAYTNSAGGSTTYGVSAQQVATFGGSLSASIGPISFDAVSYKADQSSGTYYTYTLTGAGGWGVQHLGSGGMWASCRADLVPCSGVSSSGGGSTQTSSCSFSGDYQSCSFNCNSGITIHVTSYDPTPGDYPSTHVQCGGVDQSCQGSEGATCDFGPTTSSGAGRCYSDTVKNQGSCSAPWG